MIFLKDEKTAERLNFRFYVGIQGTYHCIDGKYSIFFPVVHQPALKYKKKKIGKVILIGEDCATLGIEMADNDGYKYMFNNKYKKFLTI